MQESARNVWGSARNVQGMCKEVQGMCEEVQEICKEGTQKVCSKGVRKVWGTCFYFGNPTIKVWLGSEEGAPKVSSHHLLMFCTPSSHLFNPFLMFWEPSLHLSYLPPLRTFLAPSSNVIALPFLLSSTHLPLPLYLIQSHSTANVTYFETIYLKQDHVSSLNSYLLILSLFIPGAYVLSPIVDDYH